MEQNTKRLPTHPGDLLKEELEVRGISQKQFSSLVGISYTMLN
ncbi:MAG: addiction module antidote protein, HigA family, partial [Prevotella sp.]|nr:addiction module antidote protein, HigA family [Prevotella sp.]